MRRWIVLLAALATRLHAAAPVELRLPALAPAAPAPIAAPAAILPRAASDLPISAAPATDAELRVLFLQARPQSLAVETLDGMGGFPVAAPDVIRRHTFGIENSFVEGLRRSPAAFNPDGRRFIQAAEDLTSVADAHGDPAARRFLLALGRREAHEFYRQQMQALWAQEAEYLESGPAPVERRHLPRNALGSGDYWDVAAGMNAGGFFLQNELEPGTRYSFIERSPYVAAFLKALAELKGAVVSIVEADVMSLTRPEKPLSVLRAKNAIAYVPGFENKLEEMADWIAPGGRLALQNDPGAHGQRRYGLEKHGPLALRLLEEGWDFRAEFAADPGAEHGLDTMIFTRPASPLPPRPMIEARRLWDAYRALSDAEQRR